MAKNSIDAIINDASMATIYLQALLSNKSKSESQRLSESIEELLADILVQAQIVLQHLIDRENAIQKLQGTIINIEDELDSEEYAAKERPTPRNKTPRVASPVSRPNYFPQEVIQESTQEQQENSTNKPSYLVNISEKESTTKP